MDVLQAIHSRGSVKAFKPDPLDRNLIEQLLDAAVRAPNHKMTEPWRFYVLTGDSKRRFAELRRDRRAQRFEDPEAPEARKALEKAYDSVIDTPAVIAVATLVADDPVRREEDFAATCCAIQNMLLAAMSLGLGTYLRTGSLLEDPRLRELLGAGEGERVIATIYVGYPKEEPRLKPRAPAAEKTRWLD